MIISNYLYINIIKIFTLDMSFTKPDLLVLQERRINNTPVLDFPVYERVLEQDAKQLRVH
jgi:hypothetical protein